MSETNPTPGLINEFKADQLTVQVFEDQASLSLAVCDAVHAHLINRLAALEGVSAILATGNSQIQFLNRLVELGGIDWHRLTLFHMDEYIGIAADHPASFRHYMKERVEKKVQPAKFHYIAGDADEPIAECERYEALLRERPVQLCCLGVGENGHLAFNDPHVANFEDKRAAKIVRLDDPCKMQQVNEGHFPSIEAVPPYAITVTIPALCDVEKVFCVAPETRKAEAVKAALEGPISPACPASYLRTQPHATMLIDRDSAALLSRRKT